MATPTIRSLLNADRGTASSALLDSFGDRYLMEKNRVFRGIRIAAVQAGFKYSNERNGKYDSLPFAQLESILETETLPYTDNVTALEEACRANPTLLWSEVSEGLKRNYVFHESCHAVARARFGKLPSGAADRVLRVLLEESFANACELMGVIDADNTFHKVFYEHSSYTALFEDRSLLARAVDRFGGESLMKFLTFSYLHANFLAGSFTDSSLQETAALAMGDEVKSFDREAMKSLRTIGKIAWSLDERFREITTGMFLRTVHRIDFSPGKIDFLKAIRGNPPLLIAVNDLARAALPAPRTN